MKDIEQYHYFSASDYYDKVVYADASPEEAVYFLLEHRLHPALHRVFELHGFGLDDDYDDTINDFFLYLYEGYGDGRPFSMFQGVRDKQAFFGWTVSTYRNFLLNKAKEEVRRKALWEEAWALSGSEEGKLGEETMIRYLATAIAYADQLFAPCNLFIFYRSMLSVLDHSHAIPQEEMAEAMRLHPVTYRVRSKRQRDCFKEFILSQESGHRIDLDRRHQLMRLCIEEEFGRLYDLLFGFYNQVLERLPVKSEIMTLRMKYRREKRMCMYEASGYGYRFGMRVGLLYNALKS